MFPSPYDFLSLVSPFIICEIGKYFLVRALWKHREVPVRFKKQEKKFQKQTKTKTNNKKTPTKIKQTHKQTNKNIYFYKLLKITLFLAVQKGKGYFAMPTEDQILQISIYLQIDLYKRML